MRFSIAVLCLLGGLTLFAQTPTPNASEVPESIGNVDLSSLTAVQRKAVLKLLHDVDCTCECGMKAGDCIVKDPNCSYSRNLARIAMEGVKEGKSLVEISKLMNASPHAHRPKILEPPVKIPTAGAPMRGPANARITLVEFSDFECPYCSAAVKKVDAIMAAYPKDIKLIYKQFPLSMHPHAEMAAEASLAAREQGKFWQMYDVMFKNYRRLSHENILLWAKELGMDVNKFQSELDSHKFKAEVAKDMADGDAANVYGTPAFYIDGKQYNGELSLEALRPILTAELKGGNKVETSTAKKEAKTAAN